MKLKEGAAFIVLMLSSSAMDSDSQTIPVILVIITLLILSGQAVKIISNRKGDGYMEKYYDCSTCRYRYVHFPNMDDFEVSMQEPLCDGEDYEEEQ